jgi:hypothetical protein
VHQKLPKEGPHHGSDRGENSDEDRIKAHISS